MLDTTSSSSVTAACLHGIVETYEWGIKLLLAGSAISVWNCQYRTGVSIEKEKGTHKEANKQKLTFPLQMELQNISRTLMLKKTGNKSTEIELT